MARDCITVTVCPEIGFSLKGEIDFTLDFGAFLIKKVKEVRVVNIKLGFTD